MATITAEGLRQVLFLASTVVLARLLTPNENGLIAMVLVVTGLLDLFKDLGLAGAIIQRSTLNQPQISAIFWINVATGSALAALTAALAPVIAVLYGEPRLVLITIVISADFIFNGLMILHRALLKRQMRFSALAVIDVVVTAVETVVGIVAALAGFGYWSLVIMKLASAPVEFMALWLTCRWRPSAPARASGVGSMIAFGGNITGHRLLLYLMRNVDNLLIGRAYGPQQLGLYTKAYYLLLLPLNRINIPIASVALPALSRLTSTPQRYRDAYISIVAKVCLLSMPLVAFMISTSDWLILIVLGPQWIEASRIFAWLGISALIEPFTGTISWLFFSQGRTREQFRWGIVTSGLMILAFIAGLPWGPVGVAAAYGVGNLCLRTPLLLWVVGRSGPVRTRDMYVCVAPFAFAALSVVAAVAAFRWWIDIQNPIIGLISAAIITASVSVLSLALLPSGRTALRDLKSIASLLRGRKLTI